MNTYTKSLLNDFNNNINLDNLHEEIKNSAIGNNFAGIMQTDDNIVIMFSQSLTENELLTLNNLIGTHNSTNTIYESQHIDTVTLQATIKSKVYQKIARYIFDGTKRTNINNIKVVSYKDIEVSSYDIRIYDIINNKIITSINLNNNSIEISNFTNISNIPSNIAIFEIQVKINSTTSSKSVYIDAVTFYTN